MSSSQKRPLFLASALVGLALTVGCDPATTPVVVTPPPVPPTPPPPAAFTLQVLHGSDMESGVPATEVAPRFSAVMRALSDEYPTQTLRLASGDLWIPGVFFNAGSDPALASIPAVSSASVGRADMALFNEMNFHAASFGNHEFDSGPREILNIIASSGTWGGAKFPYLSTNLDFSKSDLKSQVVAGKAVIDANNPGTAMNNKVTSSVIFTVNGERVGVVGATTPQLPRISSPGTVSSLPTNSDDYDGLAAVIQKEVDSLRADGVNKVILMAHMQQYFIEVDELPKRLDGVDIIVAGGNHTAWTDSNDKLFPGDIRDGDYPRWRRSKSDQPVAVINVASNWRYVGRFIASFDAEGVLRQDLHDEAKSGAYAASDEVVASLNAASKMDPEVKAIADKVREVVLVKDAVIYGKTQVYLNGLRTSVRTEETNFGNMTADANLWYGQKTDATASLSLNNGGTVRDSIGTVSAGDMPTYGPPAANPDAHKKLGEISQLDIENSLRFNNDLVLVTVTASQLKEVLENGVSQVVAGATPGRFPRWAGCASSMTRASSRRCSSTPRPATSPSRRRASACARSSR